MSTVLSATKRIEFEYVVSGETHVTRHYCNVVASGDTSGYDVVVRAPGVNFGASLAIDRLWTLAAPMMDAGDTTFGVARIQTRTGTVWSDLAFYTTAVVPTGPTRSCLATNLIITMRDIDLHKVRAVWSEQFAFGPQKTTVVAGFGAPYTGLFTGYSSAGVLANHDPFHWVRGRSNQYLQGLVSMIIEDNHKLRRIRGLA